MIENKMENKTPICDALDLAIRNIQFQTRLVKNNERIGQSGSLLGDYLEFGCYKGQSFRYAFNKASEIMPWMRFFAIDSFQGLPPLKNLDQNGSFLEGQYACNQDNFLEYVGGANDRIICIPGWYEESLNQEIKIQHNLNIASIVTIDCDLYESAKHVLSFITNLVETGTVLLFDDWFCFKGDSERGVQRACCEWLLNNPNIHLQDWHLFGGFGKAFIMKKL